MDHPIIFDQVWKKFRRGQRHNSLRDLVPSLVKRAIGSEPPTDLGDKEFWAVKDVSFAVAPGEALGIIGPNGAGKSTTLKLLTRILRPTRGRCELKGRVGALIEIAAGFHPDLTGIENIFLQGAIMGMRRTEIAGKLDEIIEFAGVGDFIETQVKRYSSGMNARLGFAIAAHLNPDVLIIDEVLSVGDMSFQRKCIERMEHFKAEGVAIVFVSHNLQAVSNLCTHALFLNKEVCAMGRPDEVIQRYVELTGSTGGGVGDSSFRMHASLLRGAGEAGETVVAPGTPLTLRVTYEPAKDVSDYTLSLVVRRSTDQLLAYNGHFDAKDIGRSVLRAGERTVVDFSFIANLTRGHYYVEMNVTHNPTQQVVARLRPAASLAVYETRTRNGIAHLDVTTSLRPAEQASTHAPAGVATGR